MPYRITNETTRDKSHLLQYFRERGGEKLSELQRELGSENYKDIAGKINKALSDILQSVLLVRARENQNNHYFQILKGSGVWEAYCGEDAYSKVSDYTGFDLRDWVTININWAEDLLPDTTNYFTINNLLGYLEW